MKASEFDKKFDDGESIVMCLILRVRAALENEQNVLIWTSIWMITALDREARRMGVTRQSVIKNVAG